MKKYFAALIFVAPLAQAGDFPDPVAGQVENRLYEFGDGSSFISIDVKGEAAAQLYQYLKKKSPEWWCPESPEMKFVSAASIACTEDHGTTYTCGVLVAENGFVSGNYMACPAPSIGVRD